MEQNLSAELQSCVVQESAIHGQGLFTTRRIAAGSLVIEYLGERITRSESRKRCQQQNEYIFALTEEFHIDGNVEWNSARFINHSCAPNCEAELIREQIWIVALRDLMPGEEITFNYGYDLDHYAEHPCRCRATGCVGFIVAEEFFSELRLKQAG